MQQPALNDSRLPRAVQRQMTRVRAIEAAAKQGPGTDPAAPDQPPAPTPSDPAAPPVGAQPATPAVKTDPRHADPEYWARRIATMDGVLRKEREAHAAEVEGLHQRVVELEEEVATLKAQPSAPSSSVDLGKYFTPEQVERIGEDEAMSMAQAAEKATHAAVAAALAQVEAKLKPMREQQQRDTDRGAAQKRRDFLAAVEAEVPDLIELNNTQGWVDWLAQREGKSAFTRQETLDRHQDALDAASVVEMIKAYKATLETPAPPIAPSGDTTTSATPIEPTKPGLKPLLKSDITEFYKRAALNKVTDTERVAFEARLKLTRPSR